MRRFPVWISAVSMTASLLFAAPAAAAPAEIEGTWAITSGGRVLVKKVAPGKWTGTVKKKVQIGDCTFKKGRKIWRIDLRQDAGLFHGAHPGLGANCKTGGVASWSIDQNVYLHICVAEVETCYTASRYYFPLKRFKWTVNVKAVPAKGGPPDGLLHKFYEHTTIVAQGTFVRQYLPDEGWVNRELKAKDLEMIDFWDPLPDLKLVFDYGWPWALKVGAKKQWASVPTIVNTSDSDHCPIYSTGNIYFKSRPKKPDVVDIEICGDERRFVHDNEEGDSVRVTIKPAG